MKWLLGSNWDALHGNGGLGGSKVPAGLSRSFRVSFGDLAPAQPANFMQGFSNQD